MTQEQESLKNNEIPLCEVLVKTTYQTQITHESDKKCEKPIGYGCGFMVRYKDTTFFITADHVVHPADYEDNKNIRTGIDYVVSIFNNVKPKDEFLSTVITPLGGFYYMERFNLIKPNELPELIDVSVCIMKEKHFQYPFLTDEVHFNGLTVSAGEKKFSIPEECFAAPKQDTMYFVYGKIRTHLKGIIMHRQDTLKEGLKYMSNSGDYFLLNTPDFINDYEDWAGLSGSPVLSETGECIGVLCAVRENSNSIWVMPIEKVKMLMDIAISQEKLDSQMQNSK